MSNIWIIMHQNSSRSWYIFWPVPVFFFFNIRTLVLVSNWDHSRIALFVSNALVDFWNVPDWRSTFIITSAVAAVGKRARLRLKINVYGLFVVLFFPVLGWVWISLLCILLGLFCDLIVRPIGNSECGIDKHQSHLSELYALDLSFNNVQMDVYTP